MSSIFVYITEHLKKISIITIVLGIVFGLGISINKLIPWEYITYFFVIIRHALDYIDFMVHTPALLAGITIVISAKILYISTRATVKIIKYFE